MRIQFGKNETPAYSKMSDNRTFKFNASIRGFYYFEKFWKPRVNEKLDCW